MNLYNILALFTWLAAEVDLDVTEDDAPFRMNPDRDDLSRLINCLTERVIIAINLILESQTERYKTAVT